MNANTTTPSTDIYAIARAATLRQADATAQKFSVKYEPRGIWGVWTAYFATREAAVAFVDANGEGHVKNERGFSTYIRYDDNTIGFDNA